MANLTSAIPEGISSYSDYVNQPKTINEEMGQREFLLLFTTQLQNQNPLDPLENEAFVAQLAQFSSLESMKGMQRPWMIWRMSPSQINSFWVPTFSVRQLVWKAEEFWLGVVMRLP